MNPEHEKILLQEGQHMFARFKGIGAREEDLQELYSRIRSLQEWYSEFTKVAQKYEKAGEEATNKEDIVSNYLRAAAYYHIGELFIFTDTEEKKRNFDSMSAVFTKASRYFPFHTEKVSIPYNNVNLHGYFHWTEDNNKAPCVILVRGVDACREVELHIISKFLLKEGFVTLSIDLPGQGYARLQGLKMTADFEKPVGSVINYLLTKPNVDGNQIGILGMSFGGFIAPRAASLEKRIKACVSLGGYFGLDEFEFSLGAKLHCFNNMRISNEDEWEQKRKDYSLKGLINNLSRPLLVVNGSEDKVIPVEQSFRIYEQAPGPKEIKIYQGLGHCVFYEQPDVLSFIASWMKERLTGK